MNMNSFQDFTELSQRDDDTEIGDFPERIEASSGIQPNTRRRSHRKSGELIPFFFLAVFICFVFSSFFQEFLMIQTRLMGPQLVVVSSIFISVVIYCYNKFYIPSKDQF